MTKCGSKFTKGVAAKRYPEGPVVHQRPITVCQSYWEPQNNKVYWAIISIPYLTENSHQI